MANENLIYDAINNSNLNYLNELLKNGAGSFDFTYIFENKQSIINFAITKYSTNPSQNAYDIIKTLIDYGKQEILDKRDGIGMVALDLAYKLGLNDIASMIIKKYNDAYNYTYVKYFQDLIRNANSKYMHDLSALILCGDYTNNKLEISSTVVQDLVKEGCVNEWFMHTLCAVNSDAAVNMLEKFLTGEYTGNTSIDVNRVLGGSTMFFRAIESGNAEAVGLLLKYAGVTLLKPFNGLSPFDYALKLKKHDIALIIMDKLLLANKKEPDYLFYNDFLNAHNKPINVKKDAIQTFSVDNVRLSLNVGTVKPYVTLKLPNIPMLLPYNITGVNESDVPEFYITAKFKKQGFDQTIPKGAELLLKKFSIDIKDVDFVINCQNNPWDPKTDPLELKFHSWLHKDAPTSYYTNPDGKTEFNTTDHVEWAIIPANGQFSSLIIDKGNNDHAVATHGYGGIVFSPDNMKITEFGIKTDPKVSCCMFSLGICPKYKTAVLTMHCALNKNDARKLNNYIGSLQNQDVKNFNFVDLAKILSSFGVDSYQGMKFLSNLSESVLIDDEVAHAFSERKKEIVKLKI